MARAAFRPPGLLIAFSRSDPRTRHAHEQPIALRIIGVGDGHAIRVAHLDQATEQNLLKTLHELFGSEATVVLVTHRMKLLQLTKKLIVMAGGKPVMMGPTAQVLEKLKGQSTGGKPTKPVRLAS